MGQNNDPTERGDLQGNQGSPKGTPKSAYLTPEDRPGTNLFGRDPAVPAQTSDRAGGDAARDKTPSAIPLPGKDDAAT